jgi:hypothetical protein
MTQRNADRDEAAGAALFMVLCAAAAAIGVILSVANALR